MKIYKKPRALTMSDWNVFYDQIRTDYPIQHFLRETLVRWFDVKVVMRLSDIKWKFKHRFIPKHQYHIIRPRSLTPGYYDPDTRIFTAAFDEVSTYAENSLMGNGVDGTKWSNAEFEREDHFEGEKAALLKQFEREKQIIALRNWWVIERPKREAVEDEILDKAYGNLADVSIREIFELFDNDEETPERQNRKQHTDKLRELEEQWDEEDNKKFHELVDLLPHMWYT